MMIAAERALRSHAVIAQSGQPDVVHNSLDSKRCPQPGSCCLSRGIVRLWATVEAPDEERFTFQIRPPQGSPCPTLSTEAIIVSVVHATAPGLWWSLRSKWTHKVCAAAWCLGDVIFLCCMGAPCWCENCNRLRPCLGSWPIHEWVWGLWYSPQLCW